ncbi:SphA family protein [Microbulbifer elongatus]|uniref:SphA family protein n=1 Tax=Microbulbifer elongatus TaxID=86173 RepID=UPI001E43E7A0|nr:transporter [Microbulbifer elongatus]
MKKLFHLLGVSAVGILSLSLPLRADEGGVSFWLPGQYASFSAIAPTSEWSLPMQTYYYSGSAESTRALTRGNLLSFGLDTDFAAQFLVPTYSPDKQILGARPSLSLALFPGYADTSAVVATELFRQRQSDSVSGFGDLYPTLQLFWNHGTHNWMTYITGDIPVGSYNPNRLSNLGIGHGAVDIGGGYTYMNTKSGWEFSATAGFTYNLENSDTHYQSGIDSHLDLGLSRSLTEQFFVGLVGYAYMQLTPDSGQPPALGDFKSRTFAVGPQIGYTFQAGSRSIFLNLRGYGEFSTKHRPEGGDIFMTINIPLTKGK